MSLEGSWNVVMKTPMGDRDAVATLSVDGDSLSGTVASDGNSTEIKDGKIEGGRGKFDVDVTTPMPITLSFDIAADGDTMEGTVKLGMFGNAPVSGTRA